jgi:hypothetical protein
MEPKKRECDHCHNEYTYKIDSSKFCSNKCRVANDRAIKKAKALNAPEEEEEEIETEVEKPAKEKVKPKAQPAGLLLNGLTPQAQYIVNHQDKQITNLENELKEKQKEIKELQNDYDALKEEHKEYKHKQTLSGIESTAPTWYEKVLAALPPEAAIKVTERVLKFIPGGEQQALVGTDGQLDGESTQWAQEMVRWFSSLPKQSQATAAGLIGELSKVPGDQLNDVVIRMINILAHGTTVTTEKRGPRYGGI